MLTVFILHDSFDKQAGRRLVRSLLTTDNNIYALHCRCQKLNGLPFGMYTAQLSLICVYTAYIYTQA